MSLYSDVNDTWLIRKLTPISRVGIAATAGVAIGVPYGIARASMEIYDFVYNPSDYKFELDRYQLAGLAGIPATRFIDAWLIRTGGMTLAEARTGRSLQTLSSVGRIAAVAAPVAVPAALFIGPMVAASIAIEEAPEEEQAGLWQFWGAMLGGGSWNVSHSGIL
ncbi:MAG: hypothetical protein [Circular genetic element sp.]|nr:MAG: hypothetical protein [Circular genetic element sp.]